MGIASGQLLWNFGHTCPISIVAPQNEIQINPHRALILASNSEFAICGDGASAPISTERPAVTGITPVVPEGSLVVENGFAVTTSRAQQTLDTPETLFRFGLAPKTELRVATPNYFGISGHESGFGDLNLGAKQQPGDAPWLRACADSIAQHADGRQDGVQSRLRSVGASAVVPFRIAELDVGWYVLPLQSD